MFDRWGLLVSLTQCCPSMDFLCISASQLSWGPHWASPGCGNHSHSQFRQLFKAALKAGLKAAGWFEGNMAQRFFKGSIWNQPGGSLPIYPQIPTESWSWWRASYTPPSLHWSFQACASAWQKGLPFRGGTRQWLRVWWKNEAVLMELPYGSEHSLEGI